MTPGLLARALGLTGDGRGLVLPIPGWPSRYLHLHAETGEILVASSGEEGSDAVAVAAWRDGRWFAVPADVQDSGPTDGPRFGPTVDGAPGLAEALASLLSDPASILLSLDVMSS